MRRTLIAVALVLPFVFALLPLAGVLFVNEGNDPPGPSFAIEAQLPPGDGDILTGASSTPETTPSTDDQVARKPCGVSPTDG